MPSSTYSPSSYVPLCKRQLQLDNLTRLHPETLLSAIRAKECLLPIYIDKVYRHCLLAEFVGPFVEAIYFGTFGATAQLLCFLPCIWHNSSFLCSGHAQHSQLSHLFAVHALHHMYIIPNILVPRLLSLPKKLNCSNSLLPCTHCCLISIASVQHLNMQ